ncbi:MAG: hypothetical protein ACHQ53_03115 [Polyangiales bacterium]
MAPGGGGFSVVGGASRGDGGSNTASALDAASPTDAASDAAMVCTPGLRSIPYSAADPCRQGLAACVQPGWVAITTCQSDGTWDSLACICYPGPDAGAS